MKIFEANCIDGNDKIEIIEYIDRFKICIRNNNLEQKLSVHLTYGQILQLVYSLAESLGVKHERQ